MFLLSHVYLFSTSLLSSFHRGFPSLISTFRLSCLKPFAQCFALYPSLCPHICTHPHQPLSTGFQILIWVSWKHTIPLGLQFKRLKIRSIRTIGRYFYYVHYSRKTTPQVTQAFCKSSPYVVCNSLVIWFSYYYHSVSECSLISVQFTVLSSSIWSVRSDMTTTFIKPLTMFHTVYQLACSVNWFSYTWKLWLYLYWVTDIYCIYIYISGLYIYSLKILKCIYIIVNTHIYLDRIKKLCKSLITTKNKLCLCVCVGAFVHQFTSYKQLHKSSYYSPHTHTSSFSVFQTVSHEVKCYLFFVARVTYMSHCTLSMLELIWVVQPIIMLECVNP